MIAAMPMAATSYNAPTDEELAERVQAGEVPAVREIYGRYYAMLEGRVANKLREGHRYWGSAEDLALQIFENIVLCQMLEHQRYDPNLGRFSSWFWVCADRKYIDYVFRARRDPLDTASNIEDVVFVSPKSDPSDDTNAKDIRAAVDLCLASLSEAERKAIVLKYYQRAGRLQIAQQLRISLYEVDRLLRTARQKLAACLTRKFSEPSQ